MTGGVRARPPTLRKKIRGKGGIMGVGRSHSAEGREWWGTTTSHLFPRIPEIASPTIIPHEALPCRMQVGVSILQRWGGSE